MKFYQNAVLNALVFSVSAKHHLVCIAMVIEGAEVRVLRSYDTAGNIERMCK